MNPFASEFVPTIQMDSTEQREFEREYLMKQIEITQYDLNTSNARLLSFHKHIISLHSLLENALSENANGYTQEQIDDIHQKYVDEVAIYQQDYKKFNDLTSDVITLRNKLQQLSIMPLPPPKRANKIETANGTLQTTPRTPTQILPPIMESDDESSWNDMEVDDVGYDHDMASTYTVSTQTTFSLNLPDELFTNKIHKEMKCENNNDLNLKMEIETHSHSYGNDEQFDYMKFENDINLMLDDVMYADIKSICAAVQQFIRTRLHHLNDKKIELLIDCIIEHGMNNKPSFFGHQYALLCHDLISFVPSFNENYSSSAFKANIWRSCKEKFIKIQFGNDPQKFIAVMIIIAEVYNVDIIASSAVFSDIFDKILPGSPSDLCENDIEGLTILLKKCGHNLDNKFTARKIDQYFYYLNHIKNWKKFKMDIIGRASHLIDEIQEMRKNKWIH